MIISWSLLFSTVTSPSLDSVVNRFDGTGKPLSSTSLYFKYFDVMKHTDWARTVNQNMFIKMTAEQPVKYDEAMMTYGIKYNTSIGNFEAFFGRLTVTQSRVLSKVNCRNDFL